MLFSLDEDWLPWQQMMGFRSYQVDTFQEEVVKPYKMASRCRQEIKQSGFVSDSYVDCSG